MEKNTHSYYIYNMEIIPVLGNSKFQIPEQSKIIYEVIRVINSKLLFLEDHLSRFINSCNQSGIVSPLKPDEITIQLKKLVEKTKIQTGNIKFLCSSIEESVIQFYAFFIPHNYPTANDYINGVKLTLIEAKRTNPNIKEENKSLRESSQSLISREQAYEALLVHPNGYITEGSKSNFFIIKDNTVFTAPLNEVLEGITAKQIIRRLKKIKIPIMELPIPANSLSSFEACFITGTSPKILPVRKIDSISYATDNPLLQKIIREFDSIIEKYLKSH